MMRNLLSLLIVIFLGTSLYGQGKKSVKKHNIKGSVVMENVEGKDIYVEKKLFDKNGEIIEETDYDKDGALKSTHKYKRNSDGDVLEEEVYSAKDKTTEKHIYKYNALGDRTEEQIFDASGRKLKTHVYSYDTRGLKTERKTIDPAGKVVTIRKYTYEK